MYKMTIDERELLVSIIGDLTAQIEDAEAAGDDERVIRLIERRAFVQERLDQTEVVAVEELDRPHYADLLEEKVTLSPAAYHRLCVCVRDIPDEINRLLDSGMDRSEGRIKALEHQHKDNLKIQQRCIVVPKSMLRHL